MNKLHLKHRSKMITNAELDKERNIFLGGFIILVVALYVIWFSTSAYILDPADLGSLQNWAGWLTLASKCLYLYLVFRLSRFLGQPVWQTVLYCILSPFAVFYLVPLIGLLFGVQKARKNLSGFSVQRTGGQNQISFMRNPVPDQTGDRAEAAETQAVVAPDRKTSLDLSGSNPAKGASREDGASFWVLIGLSTIAVVVLILIFGNKPVLTGRTSHVGPTSSAPAQKLESAAKTPVAAKYVKPTATKAVILGCVNSTGRLNIRKGPGTSFAVLGSLHPGDCVAIVDLDSDNKWAQIDRGWVSADFLIIQQEQAASPPPRPLTKATALPVNRLAKQTGSDEEILAVLYENVEAMNREEIEKYLETIHPQSPVIVETRELFEESIRNYDLWVELKDLAVLEKTSAEARVRFTLITKKLRGPEFRDNRVTGVFTLKKHQGEWKIYSQEISQITYE